MPCGTREMRWLQKLHEPPFWNENGDGDIKGARWEDVGGCGWDKPLWSTADGGATAAVSASSRRRVTRPPQCAKRCLPSSMSCHITCVTVHCRINSRAVRLSRLSLRLLPFIILLSRRAARLYLNHTLPAATAAHLQLPPLRPGFAFTRSLRSIPPSTGRITFDTASHSWELGHSDEADIVAQKKERLE